MSVFLWTHIVEVHLIRCCLIYANERSVIAVDIILFRTTAKVLYIVHLCRQAETHTDTGDFQFGGSLAGSITSGSKCSHAGSFGNFCFCRLHIR